MDFGFEGFETSDFDVDVEEIVVRKTKKFTRMWKMEYGGGVTEVVYHEGVVYITSADHHVYAVDARKGKELWRYKTSGIICDSLPIIEKSFLYVGSYDKYFYCINLDGKLVWKFKTGGEIGSSPSISEHGVHFGSRDGYVYCIEAKTGKEIWIFKTGDEIASASTVYENKLLIGSYDGYMYCLDTKDGKLIWKFKTGDHVWADSKFPVQEGIVYFASFDSNLYAVDVETGKEIWRFKTGNYGNAVSPIVHDKVIYHPSRDGILYAINLEGRELWRYRTGNVPVGPPIARGNVIYVTSDSNYVAALNAKTGKEIWRFNASGYTWWQVLVEDILYVGSWDCHLYALNAKTGKEVWRFPTSVQYQPLLGPPHDFFEMEVKKETHTEDSISEDKYKSKNEQSVSLSDYHVTSEYATTSEYKQKSDYDTSFVIFEAVLEDENLLVTRSQFQKHLSHSVNKIT